MTKEEHFQKELKRLKAEEEDAVRRMGRRPSKFDIPENAPAVLLTEALLRSAALLEASDIHLSPKRTSCACTSASTGNGKNISSSPRRAIPPSARG